MISVCNYKLIRFIACRDVSTIFNFNSDSESSFDSTFIMRSLSYYRNVENDAIRDDRELILEQSINHEVKNREDIQPYYYLVSCWSLYDEIKIDELSNKFIGSANTGVAIISTVNKVNDLIKRTTVRFRQPECRYQNKKITYYSEQANEDRYENWFNEIRFMKRNIFENEHEYRFVFDTINLDPGLINTIIFNVKSNDYIDEIIGFRITDLQLSEFCSERDILYTNYTLENYL